MKASETQLSVWSGDHSACIKVSGRANFSASIDFKAAMLCLQQQGCLHFMLDLTDCVLMDSTFVGVLAGLGRVLEGEAAQDPSTHRTIEIFNPNPRVTDLLDNLGVTGLFKIFQGDPPDLRHMSEVKWLPGPTPGRFELSKACLEAHHILSELNPKNAAAFQGVTQCLEKEIRNQEKKTS